MTSKEFPYEARRSGRSVKRLKLNEVVSSQGARVGLLAALLKIVVIQAMLGWDKFLQIQGYTLANFSMFAILGALVGFYMPGPLNHIKAFLVGFLATLVYNLSAVYLFAATAAIPMAYELMYGVETGALALGVYYILYRKK